MKVSKTQLRMGLSPLAYTVLRTLMANNARVIVGAVAAMVDNSTGAVQAGGVLQPVNLPSRGAGGGLALRADFNTAATAADNAISVLAAWLNVKGITPLQFEDMKPNTTGVITTAGTVPAMTKAVGATDGTGSVAVSLTDALATLSALRNNLSTVLRAYNALATAFGLATVKDSTNGKAAANLDLVDVPKSAAGVSGTAVAASASDCSAAFLAMANDVATLASLTNVSLFLSPNGNKPVTITLIP